jgi:hydrogenase maturation protease
MRAVVLGLGNSLRTDDGAGIHAVRRLSAHGRLPKGVEAIDGGTLGLDLLPELRGVSHLLVLDAVETGSLPGTLSTFTGAELSSLPASKSVHLLGLTDLLGAMHLLGDSPSQVVLLGVQPGSIDWGTELTPAVDAVLKDLVEIALAQVSDWI